MPKEKLQDSMFYKDYSRALKEMKIKLTPEQWWFVSFVAALLFSTLLYFFMVYVDFGDAIFSVIAFVLIGDLMVGYPYMRALRRLDEIECDLPDALKQMADILKSGGTYEAALKEVAQSEYGYLTEEFQNCLRKLEEGENFETSLSSLSENIDSRLVQRTITIIIDSIRAGAGLADVLEEISDDARELHRLTIERRTRTLMQAMFMVAAGALISPFIFGMVSEIISYLIRTATSSGVIENVVVGSHVAQRSQILVNAIVSGALSAKDTIVLMLEFYLFVQVFAVSCMIALMREGKIAKAFLYFPVLLFVAFVVFFLSRIFITSILGGFGS